MSFGFSIGDILAVSNLALGICRRVRDSSDQFRAVRGEAASLRLVLNDLAEQISNGQLSPPQIAQLSTLVVGCRSVLEDLDAKVKEYKSLDTHPSGLGPKTGKFWKKLKWDQNEADALRLRLISSTTGLEVFYSGVASHASHAVNSKIDILDDRVKSLQMDVEHKDRQAILDWLSNSKFSARQTALSNRRQEGTGSWLIDSEIFKTWLEYDGRNLICQGIPGAGKSMMASLVIDHLNLKLREGKSGVIYIYCDYRAQREQTSSSLIASLLKQSLEQQPAIPTEVKMVCQRHMKGGSRPQQHEVLKMLQTAMEFFPRNYVIVDALDELSSQDRVRHTLLEELRSLQVVRGYNLLTTSRHIAGLTQYFEDPLCLEIRASSGDIQRYVRGHMTQLASCVRANMELQEVIVSSITSAVDGMFLLAQLHIDSLKDKISPKAIKMTLKNLSSESQTLDKAYQDAIQRIDDQMEGFRKLAKHVLGWLTYSESLMSVTQLRHAIAVEPGERELDEDSLVDVSEFVSVCAGLVIVDDQSQTIRLVHYTTQDYLERNGQRFFPGAQQTIAESCLVYLMYDTFATGWLYKADGNDDDDDGSDDGELTPEMSSTLFRVQGDAPRSVIARSRDHPFYLYAVQHWATHTRYGVTESVKTLFIDFARDDEKISSATQVLAWLPSSELLILRIDRSQIRSSKAVSVMHLLSYLGVDDLISTLLDNGFEADVKDWNNATPLWWAVRGDRKNVVELLLSRKSVDVNHLNLPSKLTALFVAIANGHVEITELLLACDGIDVNVGDDSGYTPLMMVALWDDQEIVKSLMSHKSIDVSVQDSYGKTAMDYAAEYNHKEILSLLLEHADKNTGIGNNNQQGTLDETSKDPVLEYPELPEQECEMKQKEQVESGQPATMDHSCTAMKTVS